MWPAVSWKGSDTLTERVAIIGLDSATPLLVERWRSDLPNLSALIDGGAAGRLRTTHPPITVPAWTSMTSSKDPGQLGIYGFRNRRDHSYAAYRFANSLMVKEPRLWDLLGEAGKTSVVLGVPQTYPPRPIRGEMVSCFLTPNSESRYTHPPALRDEVERITGGYQFDVDNFRTEDKAGLLERCYTKTEKHMTLVKHMLETRKWDFFMTVEMGVDRMHHGFWSYMDPSHRKYRAGNPFEDAILNYYRYIDGQLGEILDRMPAHTTVMVVSDHGARPMDGGLCFNEWLIKTGYLRLKRTPAVPVPLDRAEVDWGSTRAWGDGGYYGRCFVNLRGREPLGTVDPADYEKVRDDLIEEIEAIEGPDGKPLGSKAHRPEELFRATNGVAPDLLVYFGDLAWRSVGSVGGGSIYTFDNDTGPDEANHDWLGLVAIGGAGPLRGDLGEVSIYDVAPTVLSLMGQPTVPGMVGSALC